MADEPAADPSKTGHLVPAVGATTPRIEGSDTKVASAGILNDTHAWDGGGTGTGDAPPAAAAGDKWFGYAAQAALVIAIVGFGWAVGGHLYGNRQTNDQAAEIAAHAQAAAEQSELRRATLTMAADIKVLKSSLEALKAAGARTPTAEEIRQLEHNVDAIKGKLDATKTETTAALAQLGGKVDRAQAEPAGKLREMAERLERIEKQTSAPLTTASIPPQTVTVAPTPLPLPRTKASIEAAAAASAATETDAKKAPQLIAGWVVRDVYDGVALLEGPRGPYEVIPGATIPGVGTVKSIQRRGAGWIVVTSRGLVDSARNRL